MKKHNVARLIILYFLGLLIITHVLIILQHMRK
ncbi:hypothetical protein SODG_005582 [Sodalis praecaptivus]